MAKNTPNEAFKRLIKRIILGLAAQEGMEEREAKELIRDELAELSLLDARSIDTGANPLDHWLKGYVPAKWRVVEYLAETGFNRARLGDKWLNEFLDAAGYAEYKKSILSELSPAKGVLHNLPQYDPTRFVGREEELEKLHRLLSSGNRSWIIQIDGIGGVGKSELALQMADWFRENYSLVPKTERFEAIIWITAKEEILDAGGIVRRPHPPLNLNDVYIAIAETLDRPDIRAEDERRRLRLVYQALARQRTLLIIDNLEADWGKELVSFIDDVPPPTKVIVTTRQLIDEPQRIRLEGLPEKDALRLIMKEADLKNVPLAPEEAARLHQAIGGIPLVIKWCIGQMAFGLPIKSVLLYLEERESDVNRYIFEESIRLIADRPAYRLLLALSFAPGDLPRRALGMMAGLEHDAHRRDQELVVLEKLSLVNRDPDTDRFSLLPMTRTYLSHILDDSPELDPLLSGLVRYYQEVFPAGDPGPDRFWYGITRFQHEERLEQEWPNVRDILSRLHRAGDDENLLTLGLPLVHTMNLLGLRAERLELCQWLIDAARRLNDPVEAWLLIDGLGWMLHMDGRHDEWLAAIEAGRRAVAQYGGPETALILADVHEAYVHIVKQEMARAESLLQSAYERLPLAGAENLTDPIERLVASRECDRGVNYQEAKGNDAKAKGNEDEANGYYIEARKLCFKSLELRKSLGEDTGSTCYKIAKLSFQLGELDVAREWYDECLKTGPHRKYRALSQLGLAHIAEHEVAAAAEEARKALSELGLAHIAERERKLAEAERNARMALPQLEQLGLEEAVNDARSLLDRIEKLGAGR